MFLKPFSFIFLLPLASILLCAQAVEVVPVQAKPSLRTIMLPGEILPYQYVNLQARANGYVDRVLVDRGTTVSQGQLLITLVAPELTAQTAEAEFRVQTAAAMQAEAEARLAGAQATSERLKTASATPGAIAGNELIQAEKIVDVARASVRAAESAVHSAQATVEVAKQSQVYLNLTAPFAGVITERNVHPGALVGPVNGPSGGLLKLEQVSRLRLVVAVPEAEVSSVRSGTHIAFRVPAYPGRTFNGTVARVDRSLDPKTRTMAVELDVINPRSELSPGMYPEVLWPAGSSGPSLFVPSTAVVTTTERTFVIRVTNGRAEWVNVKRGLTAGELVQVLGPLKAGETIVKRATDEIREGTTLSVRKSS